jgi:hypothetical protein
MVVLRLRLQVGFAARRRRAGSRETINSNIGTPYWHQVFKENG